MLSQYTYTDQEFTSCLTNVAVTSGLLLFEYFLLYAMFTAMFVVTAIFLVIFMNGFYKVCSSLCVSTESQLGQHRSVNVWARLLRMP